MNFPNIAISAPHRLAQLAVTHEIVDLLPEHAPFARYKITLPRAWARATAFGPLVAAPGVAQSIGIFAEAPVSGAGVVGVTITPLPYDICVDDWTRRQMIVEGWEIVHARWIRQANGSAYFDIVGVSKREAGEQKIRRSMVRTINGHIFAVNCMATETAWTRCNEDFWIAGSSIELTTTAWSTQLEPWSQWTGGPPDFSFSYPTSWRAKALTSQSARVKAVDLHCMHPRSDRLLAYLRIKANLEPSSGAHDVPHLARTAVAEMVSSGVRVATEIAAVEDFADRGRGPAPGWRGTEGAAAHMDGSAVEVRVSCSSIDGVSVTLSLLCPRIEDDTWSTLRARTALQIVRETLRIVR